MLDRRWRKVFRDLWLYKARSLIVVVAMAIGIAGAGVVLDAWALVDVATKQGYRASNPIAATLRADAVDAALVARVRAVPGVADARARRSLLARVQVDGAWRTALLFVYDDVTGMRIGVVKHETGQWPPADGALVVERSSVEFSGAMVGTPLTVALSGPQSAIGLPVTGIARDVGLAPGWMEHVVYGFVNRATAASLGAPATLDELQITVRDQSLDREGVRRVAYAVKAVIEGTGRRVSNIDVPVPGEHIHAAQMDSLLLVQGAFGALTLLLGGFLVVNLIAALLAAQVREIGVMKAIGGGVGQIAGMYLVLAIALGVAAAAIAIPVAYVLGVRYAALKGDLLNFDLSGVAVPPWAVALQLGVALLLPLCAAALPVVRGCRVPVNAALRDVGTGGGSGAGGSGAWLLRIGGIARPTLLSLRNAFRRRQRLALTMLTLSTGGAVFLGARNLERSIRGAVDLVFDSQQYDLTLRFSQRHRPDSIAATIRAAGARGEGWSGARAAVVHRGDVLGNSFAITGPPTPSTMISFSRLRGRWLRAGDGNVIVVSTSWLHQEPQLTLGDTLTLVVGGRAAAWTIVGVADAGPSPSAYAPRAAIGDASGSALVDVAVVRLTERDPARQLAEIQRLRAALAGAGLAVSNSQLLVESRRVLEDHLLMVAEFLGGMAWLMIVVGGLALASTMSLAVLERTREIGVLRAIGARHEDILTMIEVEGLVIALLSWLAALPLSAPISVVLARSFGRVMLPVPVRFVPDGMGAVLWLALAISVALIACAWPAARAMRLPTRVALTYE